MTVDQTTLRSLFVKGLGKGVTERHLQVLFAPFGAIVETQIARHRSGRSAGFAIVTFDTYEEALAALKHMDNALYQGRKLSLRWFQPDSETQQAALQAVMLKGVTRLGPPVKIQPSVYRESSGGRTEKRSETTGIDEVSGSFWSGLVNGWLSEYGKETTSRHDQESRCPRHSDASQESLETIFSGKIDLWNAEPRYEESQQAKLASYFGNDADEGGDLIPHRDVYSEAAKSARLKGHDALHPGINTSDPVIELGQPASAATKSRPAELLIPSAQSYATVPATLSPAGYGDLFSAYQRTTGAADLFGDFSDSCSSSDWGCSFTSQHPSGTNGLPSPIATYPTTSNSLSPSLSSPLPTFPTSSSAGLPHSYSPVAPIPEALLQAVFLSQAQQLSAAQQQYASALTQLVMAQKQVLSAAAALNVDVTPEVDLNQAMGNYRYY